MTIQDLFIMSNQALRKVVDQITDDQWNLAMPEGTSSNPTNLIDAVRYHTYDDAWVPDILAGKTMKEVGDTYESIRSKKDIRPAYDHYNEIAISAVQDLSELGNVTHLSYGDYPARDYLQHITSFRAFRSYDIAKLIGADTTMADDFVEALQEEFSPVIENYRQMGVFPAAIKVSNNASQQAQLLAMVGRN